MYFYMVELMVPLCSKSNYSIVYLLFILLAIQLL